MAGKKNSYEKKIEELGIKKELEDDSLSFTLDDSKQLNDKLKKSLNNFSELLDNLSTAEDRKKILWKDIYENSLVDRKNAYMLFADLYASVKGEPAEHAIHGPVLTKYLERMSKANEQLIKLADLVDDAFRQEEDANFSEDDLYDQIDNSK